MRHHSTVRYREEFGFELRCEVCMEYWPLTFEFWEPPRSMTRCRGCYRDSARRAQARRRSTPEGRAYAREYTKKYRPAKARALRSDPVIGDQIREYHRDWMRRWRKRDAA